MLRHFLNPPNWFTAGNLFCGFYAIMTLMDGPGDAHSVYRAGLLVLFGAVFDMLDGRVARMTRSAGRFGTELDSLADIVSFGLTPALAAWVWGVHRLGTLGMAACFFFLVCGAFRLARYNVKAETKASARSEGITITMAGIFLALVIMSHAASGRETLERPMNAVILMTALALLMVSRVPYRTFKTVRASPLSISLLMLCAGIAVVIGVRYNISTVFMAFTALYVASGPVEGLMLLGRGRRGKIPLPLPEAERPPEPGEKP
jgi:CDP-diacylglycerol--serine O-phosphatidyltransferase